MKKVIQSENIEKRKTKIELWLGIVNIILTAIVGIGITVFLNYRDEKVQEKLITIQAETARQANSANLQVSTNYVFYNPFNQGFRIENLGPATAKNIIIVVVINDVEDEWSNVIDEIEKTSLEIYPPSLDVKLSSIKVDNLFKSNQMIGNNAFRLITDYLPVGEKLIVKLDLNSDLLVEKVTSTRMINIFYNDWKAQTYFIDEIGHYFSNLYRIAEFSVYVNCENCFIVNHDDNIVQITAAQNFSARDILTKNDSLESIWTASLAIDYRIPSQGLLIPETYPLNFRIKNPDEQGLIELTEILKP